MGINHYNRSRNIILIWNIYLTILIPFVVLLSGIWHLESGVRNGKAAGLPIAVILAFLPLVLFGLKWKMDSTFTIIVSCVWFIFMWKMAYVVHGSLDCVCCFRSRTFIYIQLCCR